MKSNKMKKWVVITAGLLLLLSVSFGLCACTTGAKEHNDATGKSQAT